jgi:magnesium-transporting ATPase (P-type)
LILIIDLGSNLVASTAMVFEDPELDIMTRNPRRPDEHLVSNQLLVFGYVQFGVIHACTGFLQWFIVLNDFGFKPSSLFMLAGL